MAGGPLREFSIPAMAEIPATATLTDIVADRASRAPGTIVLRKRVAAHQWADVTAREFGDQVRALAKGLIAAGVRPGDRVGLMARTSYLWTLIDYALWSVGAVTVPVYETSSAEQVEWILADSGLRSIVAESDAHAATIASVKSNLPDLEHIWLMDTIADLTAAGTDITDAQLEQRMAGRAADDLATIIYTSGTTGRPKGC
jgi:long-chain acyl-CoA synthetase